MAITNGTFLIPVAPAGPLTLTGTIQHPQGSGLPVSGSGTVVAGQDQIIDVMLPPVGSITGVITRPSGAVVPEAVVYAYQGDHFRITTADSTGRYTLTDLVPGTYTLAAYQPVIFRTVGAVATVGADQQSVANLTIPAFGALTGVVTEGTGAVAPNVTLELTDNNSFYQTVASDAPTWRRSRGP